MSSLVLLVGRLSLVLYSAKSGVKSVQVVLSVLSMGLFDFDQMWMLRKNGYMFTFAACMLLYIAIRKLQQIYLRSMSEVYVLKSLGERMLPCRRQL